MAAKTGSVTPAARKTRTFRSSQDRRAEIVEAAFHCLQEVGYAKLTARKIAEHSKISLGHITYNFKDMNEVLVETYKYASRILLDATLQDLSRSVTPIEQLRAFLRTGFTPVFLKRDYLRVRIDLWSAALGNDEIALAERTLYERYRQNLIMVLQRVAGDASAQAEAVTFLADMIMATLDGLWLDWERRQSESAIHNGLEGCIRLVETMLLETTKD